MTWRAWLTALWRPDPDDGLATSAAEAIRWMDRFRRARLARLVWRRPDADEQRRWEADPLVSRFGDECHALTTVDGRQWVVMERTWHGWPDPPRFAWFALEPDGEPWAAADVDGWPRRWLLS